MSDELQALQMMSQQMDDDEGDDSENHATRLNRRFYALNQQWHETLKGV